MTGRHRTPQPDDERSDAAPVEITVLAGEPTDQELAAVTAVLTALEREAESDLRVGRTPPRSAWQAGVRAPLTGGRGGWVHAVRW